MRTSDETIRELEKLAKNTPLCESWMGGGIRHLVRNVDSDAFTSCGEDKSHVCIYPDKYDGAAIAAAANALPNLLADLRDLAAMEKEFDQLAERLAERTAERDAAIQERDEARAAFDKYGEHFQNCATNAFQQFDPGPPRRWKYGGEWMSSIPTCTCGLDAAIGGQG